MAPRSLLSNASKLPTNYAYFAHRLHVMLGLYVISHFLYRYTYFFLRGDSRDMGFDAYTKDANDTTISFVILFLPHLLLQISGFYFPLPTKRHPDGNRIWPQYRWEALVFCIRCLCLAFIAWRRKLSDEWTHENYSIMPAAVCVMLTMLAADKIAISYGSQGSRTIRDLTAPKQAQYLMSSAQFHATLHCLLTSDKLKVQIAALTVVQLSAFGMTLRRKGYISQKEGVCLYAFVLIVGMMVIVNDLRERSLFNLASSVGNVAAILRMYFGMNKYAMWSAVVVILTLLQRNSLLSDEGFPCSLPLLHCSSWLLLLSSCYLKYRRK